MTTIVYNIIPYVTFSKNREKPFVFNQNSSENVYSISLFKEKYKRLDLQMVTMLLVNQFRPLFALTPGSDNIQLNLDISSQEVMYHFSIPNEKIGDYTKVTVKFMKEEELDDLLKRQTQGG